VDRREPGDGREAPALSAERLYASGDHEWLGDAQDELHWRESHYQVEGPVVAQMQAGFVDNWIKATGRVLHGPEFFPETYLTAGDMDAQMFGSSPVGGSESMHLMILLALTAAHTSIDIENALLLRSQL
jgi:cardiolipin synthase